MFFFFGGHLGFWTPSLIFLLIFCFLFFCMVNIDFDRICVCDVFIPHFHNYCNMIKMSLFFWPFWRRWDWFPGPPFDLVKGIILLNRGYHRVNNLTHCCQDNDEDKDLTHHH